MAADQQGKPSVLQHRRQSTNGPSFVCTRYLFSLWSSPRASHGGPSKTRRTSPSTSLIVISDSSIVEIRHFTQTLGIPEFYSESIVAASCSLELIVAKFPFGTGITLQLRGGVQIPNRSNDQEKQEEQILHQRRDRNVDHAISLNPNFPLMCQSTDNV